MRLRSAEATVLLLALTLLGGVFGLGLLFWRSARLEEELILRTAADQKEADEIAAAERWVDALLSSSEELVKTSVLAKLPESALLASDVDRWVVLRPRVGTEGARVVYPETRVRRVDPSFLFVDLGNPEDSLADRLRRAIRSDEREVVIDGARVLIDSLERVPPELADLHFEALARRIGTEGSDPAKEDDAAQLRALEAHYHERRAELDWVDELERLANEWPAVKTPRILARAGETIAVVPSRLPDRPEARRLLVLRLTEEAIERAVASLAAEGFEVDFDADSAASSGAAVPTLPGGSRLSVASLAPTPPEVERVRRRMAWQLALLGASWLVITLTAFLGSAAWRKRRRLEAARRDLTSNLSHGLKTPLAVLRVCAETLALERVRDGERAKHYAQVICNETERLHRLVDQILASARTGSLESELVREPVDLREVVERVLDAFSVRLHDAEFELVLDLPATPAAVEGEPRLLALLVENLLDNALQYAPEGKYVALRVVPDERGADWCVEVEDHGPGVPKSDRAAIFERYHRGGDPLTRRVRGSGLGLAIARDIAEAHGGRIVYRRLRSGSSFRVTLPRAGVALDTLASNESKESRGEPRASGVE